MMEAVFFDFDGVIKDSVDIKTQAFADLYRPYGEKVVQKVKAYHLKNSGISRYDKIKYWHSKYLNIEIDAKSLEDLAGRFSELVLHKIIEAPYICGALDALKDLKKRHVPAYIVTGTPEEEMCIIIMELELQTYFKEIHGSPGSKIDIVSDIIAREQLNPKECLFIGDAMADYEAAMSNGVHFLGILPKSGENMFPKGTKVKNTVEIRDYIR